MKKYKNNIISIIMAFVIVFFIWHKFQTDGNSIIFVALFVITYKVYLELLEIKNKRLVVISSITSVMFSIIEVVCGSINIDYTLNNIINKWLLLDFLGYACMAYGCIVILNTFIDRIKDKKFKQDLCIKDINLMSDNKLSFFTNFLLILISWIPFFLRYYPGILTKDSIVQISQTIGIIGLSNHHPILHTGIISLFIHIGISLFNSLSIGVAIYTVFQMMTLALLFSFVLYYVSKKRIPLIFKVILLLFYMFYPVNGLYSISMWKDVLFSGIMPIYVILTNELFFYTGKFLNNKKNLYIYFLISLLVMFLRNNGFYIVILTMPVVAIALRKEWKKIIPTLSIILIIYIVIKSAIFNIFNVKNGSIGEMLSVPLQQITRVKKYHIQEIDKETIKQIDSFFNCYDIEEKYNPTISDPVKSLLNQDYFNNNKAEFIKLWIKLLLDYPKDYIESFISNSYGYYYPEARNWVAGRGITENDLQLETKPLTNGNTSRIVSMLAHLADIRSVPLYSMAMSIGMCFWLIVIFGGYEIQKKNYNRIPIYWIIFILWLTIIASPVFCEFRYAYSMFTCLPLFVGLVLSKE